ncbi:MAG: hypothetical protein AAF664_20695 [Planctomycetota bacterium]
MTLPGAATFLLLLEFSEDWGGSDHFELLLMTLVPGVIVLQITGWALSGIFGFQLIHQTEEFESARKLGIRHLLSFSFIVAVAFGAFQAFGDPEMLAPIVMMSLMMIVAALGFLSTILSHDTARVGLRNRLMPIGAALLMSCAWFAIVIYYEGGVPTIQSSEITLVVLGITTMMTWYWLRLSTWWVYKCGYIPLRSASK